MTGELFDAATALLPDVVDLRRRLHRIPEVGLELPRTQAAVIEALDGLGLRLTTGRTDLSRADRDDHVVTVALAAGVYRTAHTRLWLARGATLASKGR